MESFELNKIAGAALAALLFIFGIPQAMEIIGSKSGHGDGHGHATPGKGYALPMPKVTPGGGAAPAKEAFSFAKVAGLLGKASADNGKDVFKKCATCHTTEKGGGVKQGPNLYGVIGEDIGKRAGFSYSTAFKEKGGKWTWENLATYLHNPREAIPGNKMTFPGLPDDNDLADLLVYLRTLADTPAPLPAAPAPASAPPAKK